MAATNNTIYLGIKGGVLAVDRLTGRHIWETRLKGSGFVNVVFDQGILLAHTGGELWAIDPESGAKLWHDGLSGFGYGHATMASATMMVSPQLQVALDQLRSEEAAAASGGGAAGA